MDKFLNNTGEVDLKKLNGKGAGSGGSFVKLATGSVEKNGKVFEINSVLSKFFAQLKIAGAEFGYRTASEIHRFTQIVLVLSPDTDINDIIDFAILQKLLPKLHGSRRKLEPVFEELIKLCLKDGVETKEFKTGKAQIDSSDKTIVKYPLSLEKIVRMYNNLVHNGFTSFAEA
jgi:5-methylcytosine-specific restriction protein B